MKIYQKIQQLNDEELKKMVKKRIASLERKSKKENPNYNVLGYHVEDNSTQYQLKKDGDILSFELVLRCFYNNYVPKGTKIVFGMTYNMTGRAGNHGNYYYMDNDDYIYDFCKFIQDKDIENEYELFDYMLEFLRNYFGHINIKDISRYDMFQLLAKDESSYFPAIREHSITDFNGKGNAMCSEYAVMAQNLMRFMGLESYLVIGNEETSGFKPDSHAFNMVTFKHSETNKRHNMLIDFSSYINIFNLDFEKIGECPFFGELERIDENLVRRLVDGDERLQFEDYSYIIIGDTLAKIGYDRTRNYYIDNHIHGDIEGTKEHKTYTLRK